MQRRARASRPGSSAGFQWPWHKIPATTGYGNRGRSNSMSRHNGRNHPMEHKRASSQPPAGLGLQGVPQPFTHHVKQQQQQNMNMNMNATPFHQPMQFVQTPMAFPPQMLQFPTTPGMGAISLQNGHAVQHPHQPQVVPKKKKVEMKVGHSLF
ncbi:hypothetical protein CPB86DRAFT_788146 [Serendipita vermifera]|nr:hypothetical protein CPB86DRAFT_788146 [Serendipita vermifera]